MPDTRFRPFFTRRPSSVAPTTNGIDPKTTDNNTGPTITHYHKSNGQTTQDPTHVLSRLHALFNSAPVGQGTNVTDNSPRDRLDRAKTEPVVGGGVGLDDGLVSPGTIIDRQAIKVLVVTWNMGDALPKGDLSVLFGEIPPFAAQSPNTGLPSLPVENKHPYHIVVIAGQECPTHSGVPRGLGGGLMKGVHVRGSVHRKDKDEKKKEKWDEKGKDDGAEENDGLSKSPMLGPEDGEEIAKLGQSPSAPHTPHTPSLHRPFHQAASKGWSTMLDDWFCGQTRAEVQATFPPMKNSPSESQSQTHLSPSPVPFLSAPSPPSLVRSSSAPTTSQTDPIHIPLSIPSRQLALAPLLLSHSPLMRSQSSLTSGSSESSSGAVTPALHSPSFSSPALIPFTAGLSPTKVSSTSNNTNGKITTKVKAERPAIVIPTDESEHTKEGSRCYYHLVKERLMGMYLSAYVYKGCEHLVQGVDKDFVTAGLAGGRVGNKGGIGISLKIAGHRFLFVNSHLAAHTSHVSARLANIAKIKSELRLDCFLPKDDPRMELPDLTDRFDTVFWCGDLNFRLDMSRLHAEWLVEQKKYSEALIWDQLKGAMRDPAKNPFPGFQEHTIDFPPTFKYDVWRSIKATNRELERSLRHRATLEGNHARRPSVVDSSPRVTSSGLPHVVEDDDQEALENAASEQEQVDSDPQMTRRNSDEDHQTIASRRSFDSNMGYASAGPSTIGIEGYDDSDPDEFAHVIDPTAYGSRHKALEITLKEKTKHFLSLVKMNGILSTSPGRRKLHRNVSKKLRDKPGGDDFDAESRRTSISSIGSLDHPPRTEVVEGRSSLSSVRSMGTSAGQQQYLGPPRRPSDAATWISSSPEHPIIKRYTVKRTVSGVSGHSTPGGDVRSDDAQDDLASSFDKSADHRAGKYDSSKKQRVPSWCDRVLWKTQVIPDPDPSTTSAESSLDTRQQQPRGGFNRLSHAFANFGGHLRISMTRTGSMNPSPMDRVNLNRTFPSPPPDDPDDPNPTLVASPEPSPFTKLATDDGPVSVPSPKRPSPRRLPTHSRLYNRSRSYSTAPHPLLDTTAPQASPPAFPKITFDSALPADADRSTLPDSRPRANSDSVQLPRQESEPKRSLSTSSSGPNIFRSRSGSGPTQPNHVKLGGPRRSSGGSSTRMRSRTKTLDSVSNLPNHRQSNHGYSGLTILGHEDGSAEDKNAFVKFIKDLPGWLHARTMSVHPPEVLPTENGLGPGLKPRRHFRGEVECLHYGTIDDLGMRQLEGRSDHRPAIFAAAVYVDHEEVLS